LQEKGVRSAVSTFIMIISVTVHRPNAAAPKTMHNFGLLKWLLLQHQMVHFPKYFLAKGAIGLTRNAHEKLHYPKNKK
jgi:hypothetical protein